MRILRSLHTINRDKQPKSTVVYLVEMSNFLVCQQSDEIIILSRFFIAKNFLATLERLLNPPYIVSAFIFTRRKFQ